MVLLFFLFSHEALQKKKNKKDDKVLSPVTIEAMSWITLIIFFHRNIFQPLKLHVV